MTTLTETKQDSELMSISNPANLALLFSPELSHGWRDTDTTLLRVSNVLQATLEIDALLKEFQQTLKLHLNYDSFGYVYEALDLELAEGKKARHTCSYQLTIGSESLGVLWLTRRKAFAKPELEFLERLLCVLLYPLRNGLKYQRALRAAYKDALTGVDNRAAMDEAILREIDLARRHKRDMGLMVLDIDHFKHINDTYGHATGDCLLRALADSVQDTVRLSDRLFRYGGEEFVVVLPETNANGARLLAERIRKNVETMESICEGRDIRMTVSIGVSTLQVTDNAESLFVRADTALYQAKHDGRNRVRLAD